jgi:ribosomal protein L17
MLKIVTDGRKATLDMRRVSDQATPESSKLNAGATTIAARYIQRRGDIYPTP